MLKRQIMNGLILCRKMLDKWELEYMLIINNEQMSYFDKNSSQRFINKLVSFFFKHSEFSFFTANYTKKSLNFFVRESIPKAHSLGFITEKNILKYIITSMLLGEDFEMFDDHQLIAERYNCSEKSNEDKFQYTFHYIETLNIKFSEASKWLLD